MWEPQANPSKKWSATKKKSQPFKNVVTKDKNTTVKYSRLEEVRDMTTKLKSQTGSCARVGACYKTHSWVSCQTGVWMAVYVKYCISVKFTEPGNYCGRVRECPCSQETRIDITKGLWCVQLTDGSKKKKERERESECTCLLTWTSQRETLEENVSDK